MSALTWGLASYACVGKNIGGRGVVVGGEEVSTQKSALTWCPNAIHSLSSFNILQIAVQMDLPSASVFTGGLNADESPSSC